MVPPVLLHSMRSPNLAFRDMPAHCDGSYGDQANRNLRVCSTDHPGAFEMRLDGAQCQSLINPIVSMSLQMVITEQPNYAEAPETGS